MTEIQQPLSRLGLSQYVPIFVENGFDTWQAILHITESDLDHLGVKLGHRRILQREIAYARGVSFEQLTSPTRTHQPESSRLSGPQDGIKMDRHFDNAPRGKRKYRRHPKNDENAPERPPSAYVIFSNRVREELKPLNLSFTEIAKRVGERWQTISPEEKGPHEKAAMELKENYHRDMDIYKTTDNYRNYAEYLANFKLKYASSADDKRPKLETENSKDSTGSGGSASGREPTDISQAGTSVHGSRRRVDSTSSTGPMHSSGGLPSPASVTGRPTGLRGGLATVLPLSNVSPTSTSPSSPSVRRDSSTGPMPAVALQPRPFVDANTDSAPYTGRSQRLHRNAPYRDGPSHQSSPSCASIDPRLAGRRDTHSPVDQEHRSGRPIPNLIHQDTSSSSNMSLGSSISTTTASTSTSSVSVIPRGPEDYDRPQLPPLSATVLHKPGVNMADYALRPSPPSSSSGNTPPTHQNPFQAPFHKSASFSGMNSNLPIPNTMQRDFQSAASTSFSQPDNEGSLANVLDLQDIPGRAPLRSLPYQPTTDPHNVASLSQARESRESPLPPLQPALPSLRLGVSAGPRNTRPLDDGARADEDRLAVLADVAHADQDQRSGL